MPESAGLELFELTSADLVERIRSLDMSTGPGRSHGCASGRRRGGQHAVEF